MPFRNKKPANISSGKNENGRLLPINNISGNVINLPNVSDWFTAKTIRRILKTKSKCPCCCCLDSGIRYDYEILKEEIKSTQKSIAHCKEDTNKILGKIAKLESFFQ